MPLKPHKTASAQKKEDREKHKYEFAICRIRRKGCQARDETLGSGFLVRDLIIPGFAFHFCLVASDKVIAGDDFENYYLEFKQFESTKLERIELNDIASSDRSDVSRTSVLIFIGISIDRIKKKTKFYKDLSCRSFNVVKKRLGSYEDLFCYFVDDSQVKSLVNQVRIELNSHKEFQVRDGVDTYSTYSQFTKGKPDGGVILKSLKDELHVVGVLQFTNEGTISPVFFPISSNEGKGKMPVSHWVTEIENGRAASESEMVSKEGQDSGRNLTLADQHSSESNQAERKMPLNQFATEIENGESASENGMRIEDEQDLDGSLIVGNQHSLQSNQGSAPGGEGSNLGSLLKSWFRFWNNSGSCSGCGNLSQNPSVNNPLEVSINPCRTPLQGGGPCSFKFIPDLPSYITSGTAKFADLGFVDLNGVKNKANCLVGEGIPAAKEEGSVTVIVNGKSDLTGNCIDLGQTQIYYYHKHKDVFRELVMNKSQLHDFFEEFAKGNAKASRDKESKSSSSGKHKRQQGSMDSGNPLFSLQGLLLLVYTAAETDAREFIELIFNSSAGRVVFNAYRCMSPLPKDVARAFGHEDTAQYLESISKRLSEDLSVLEEHLQGSHILELAEAFKNQLTIVPSLSQIGDTEQPVEPAEGEQKPPGKPAEGGEEQPPGKPAEGGEEQPSVESVEGGEEQPPVESAEGGEEQPPGKPAEGGEEQPSVESVEGGEEQPPVESAEGGEEQPPGKPAEGGEEQPSVESVEGGEEQPPGKPAEGGEEQPPVESAEGGEEQKKCFEQDWNQGRKTMELQPFRNEQLNYFKFASIVLNEFPKALRQTFKSMWDNSLTHLPGHQLWDDSTAVRKLFFTSEGGPGKTKVPTNVSYEEWDCTALFQATIYAKSFALTNSRGHRKTLGELFVKPRKLAHRVFHASVTSPSGYNAETFALAIDQLRLLRNSLCHSHTSEIVKATFDQYVQYAKDAFRALGVETDPIDVISGLTEAEFPTNKVLKLQERIKEECRAHVSFLQEQYQLQKQHVSFPQQRVEDVSSDLKALYHKMEELPTKDAMLNMLARVTSYKQEPPLNMPDVSDQNRKRKEDASSPRSLWMNEISTVVSHLELGDFATALQSAQRSTDTTRRLFGVVDPSTASMYLLLGSLERRVGNFASALRSSQNALDINRMLFCEAHSDTAQSYLCLAFAQYSLGDSASALESAKCALDIRRKLFGDIDSHTAESYYVLGVIQHSLGNYILALQSSQRALDIRRKLFGKKHSDTAQSYDSVGATQHSLGDHTSALQSEQQALDIKRKLFGEEHSDTAQSYDSVGATQHSLGDHTSALQSLQRALDIRRKLFGEEHSDTAQSYDSVGATQHSLGDHTSALQSLQRALDIRRKFFGEEHSDTAQSYYSVGVTQHSLGDHTSALQSLQRALDIRRKFFGEEHSDTAQSYYSVGVTQHSLGDHTSALQSLQRALDIIRKLSGEEHSDTAHSYDCVGVFQDSLGDHTSALQSKQRALDLRRKFFGEEHSDTAESYDSVGIIQHSLGDHTSALQSKQRALDIRRKLFGEEHSDTAQSYHSVGVTQHSLGDDTSALQSLQRALDIRRKLFGEEHLDTAQSYYSVGVTQHFLGDHMSALQSLQRALDIRRKLFGEEHLDTAQSYYSVGVTQHFFGDHTSALQSLQRALNIRRKLFGEEHSDTAKSYSFVAVTQHFLGDHASASRSEQRAFEIRRKLKMDTETEAIIFKKFLLEMFDRK